MSSRVEDGQSHAKSPFVTTTQVMNAINEQLSDLPNPLADDSNSASATAKSTNNDGKPRFELQRKFADGTTRKATPSEAAAADMESKFQQATVHVAKLKSADERREWAEQQRTLGNQLYQQSEYAEAIDVYLTCLIVAQEEKENLLFLKVMNNLAQSALKLSWNKKAIEFADLAMEHLKHGSSALNKELLTQEERKQIAKIYFKRGKAARLRGSYQDAKRDMHLCTASIEELIDSNDAAALQPAVDIELHLIEKSMQEAKKNRNRQERAMKQVLGPESSADPGTNVESLYSEKRAERQFSTVRAPKGDVFEFDVTEVACESTCWRFYLLMIGNVAKTMLIWLGDEEMENEQTKQD